MFLYILCMRIFTYIEFTLFNFLKLLYDYDPAELNSADPQKLQFTS